MAITFHEYQPKRSAWWPQDSIYVFLQMMKSLLYHGTVIVSYKAAGVTFSASKSEITVLSWKMVDCPAGWFEVLLQAEKLEYLKVSCSWMMKEYDGGLTRGVNEKVSTILQALGSWQGSQFISRSMFLSSKTVGIDPNNKTEDTSSCLVYSEGWLDWRDYISHLA